MLRNCIIRAWVLCAIIFARAETRIALSSPPPPCAHTQPRARGGGIPQQPLRDERRVVCAACLLCRTRTHCSRPGQCTPPSSPSVVRARRCAGPGPARPRSGPAHESCPSLAAAGPAGVGSTRIGGRSYRRTRERVEGSPPLHTARQSRRPGPVGTDRGRGGGEQIRVVL
jgi:hypothetical protein